MVQFLSIFFFLGFIQFLLGFSKVPFFASPYINRYVGGIIYGYFDLIHSVCFFKMLRFRNWFCFGFSGKEISLIRRVCVKQLVLLFHWIRSSITCTRKQNWFTISRCDISVVYYNHKSKVKNQSKSNYENLFVKQQYQITVTTCFGLYSRHHQIFTNFATRVYTICNSAFRC